MKVKDQQEPFSPNKGKTSTAEDMIRQKIEAEKLMEQFSQMLKENKTETALTMVIEGATKIKDESKRAERAERRKPRTREEILQGLRQQKNDLSTPYSFRNANGDCFSLDIPRRALTLICARAGHGTTDMLQNLALHMAQDSTREGDVIYVSYIDDAKRIRLRFANMYANMPVAAAEDDTTSPLNEENSGTSSANPPESLQQQLDDAQWQHGNEHLLVCDKSPKAEDLMDMLYYCTQERKVKAVFIDNTFYLHKNNNTRPRWEELSDICNELHHFAIKANIPVVLAAGLNYNAISPLHMTSENIAESYDMAGVASMIICLWNSDMEIATPEAFWGEKTKELKYRGFSLGGDPTAFYAVLAKNRHGEPFLDAVLKYNSNTGIIYPER